MRKAHQIKFNTDSSNLKDDYLRNHLRHHVIPVSIMTSNKRKHTNFKQHRAPQR
jgi:tRNA(Ile)-lysidine synthase TilS/MesJ